MAAELALQSIDQPGVSGRAQVAVIYAFEGAEPIGRENALAPRPSWG